MCRKLHSLQRLRTSIYLQFPRQLILLRRAKREVRYYCPVDGLLREITLQYIQCTDCFCVTTKKKFWMDIVAHRVFLKQVHRVRRLDLNMLKCAGG